ncbi:MAG: carboxymuconolactone decarboxylase family protein [Planctomycetes bacterium]|nr:carboxymuconolactone decarboxylase family protein [Planctomycetota bacterium]
MPPALRLLPSVTAAIARGDEPGTARAARKARAGGVSAEAIYEAALQTYLFAGYPRGISGLAAVARAVGPAAKPQSTGGLRRWEKRGLRLCRRIYEDATDRMLANMKALHPAIATWIIQEGYGKVLSRPGLEAAVREACAVSSLAALGAWRQLESHARGALRVGVPLADLRRAAGGTREARRIVMEAAREILPNPARKRSLNRKPR